MTLVKICGLMRPEDADAVNAAGADFAGFILSAGFRRSKSMKQAAAISAHLDPAVTAVGVFVDEPAAFIAPFVEAGAIRAIQLHGGEGDDYIGALRERLPGTPIVKAFKIRSVEDIAEANASTADLVLLDNGQGTGEAFDWNRIGGIGRRYVLAGGLNPGNVADAVNLLRPYAVDMSSGVETQGSKDPEKIMRAVSAARSIA